MTVCAKNDTRITNRLILPLPIDRTVEESINLVYLALVYSKISLLQKNAEPECTNSKC